MNAELGSEPLLYRTRAELRLAELEAIKRPLTKAEGAELQRCLHAIYMRNWRLIKGVTGCGGDLADVQRTARTEVGEIAARMEAADDPAWPKPKAPPPAPPVTWQSRARDGSERLFAAIKLAGVHP